MQTLLDGLIPLLALAAMEIVLGIDNLVFIAILSGKLPEEQRPLARQLGLAVALLTRLALLFLLTWFMSADQPLHLGEWIGLRNSPEQVIPHAHAPPLETDSALVHGLAAAGEQAIELAPHEIAFFGGFVRQLNHTSLKDLILLLGGFFLVGKSVLELHHMTEDHGKKKTDAAVASSFVWVVTQIALMDMVFSLDSVITAIGMVKPEDLWIMITAIVLAMAVMVLFANPVSEFVDRHPTLKVLALSFLILIGVMLMGEGTGQHIDKGYIYTAMVFALIVELINLRIRGAADHADEVAATSVAVAAAGEPLAETRPAE